MQDDEGFPGVVVPDDISELDADVRAYHRELRAQRRRRSALGRLGDLGGGAVLVAMLVVVGLVGTLVTMLLPQEATTRVSRRVPLATSAAAAPGVVGGVVPDALLIDEQGTTHSLRDLRPALLVSVPDPCDDPCRRTLSSLSGQAAEYAVDLVVAAPADADLPRLRRWLRYGSPVVGRDHDGVVGRTWAGPGPTAVLIAPDGTVRDVDHAVTPDTRLEGQLHAMLTS